jgi:hypothetical protein
MRLPKLYLTEWAVIAAIITAAALLIYAAMNGATK